MAGHAKLSPSGSSRWIACPGSVNLTKDLQNKSGDAAYRGTIIHQAGEELLIGDKDYLGPGVSIIVEQDNGTSKVEYLAKDMYEEAKFYADYVKSIAERDEDSEIIPEMKIDLTEIAPDTFGHSDAVVTENNNLHIIDLKTGAGLVEAKDNSQLMIYAYGAYLELEDFHYIHNIVLHIVQNNARSGGDKTNSFKITVEELLAYIDDVVKPAAEEALKPDARCIPGEIQCKWCPAASFCTALLSDVEDAFDDITSDHQDENPKDIGKVVSMDKAVEFYKSLSIIDIWKKAIEGRMFEELNLGKEVPGFKLVKKVKHKKWINEEEAFNKLKSWEKLDDIAPRKLVTPNQADKILGKMSTAKKNKFDQLWVRPEGELTVVPESDKRPAEKPTIDDFEDL